MQATRKTPLLFRLSLTSFVLRHPDAAMVFSLLALTLIGEWDLLRSQTTLGSDAATQYYLFYYFLGKSLSSGQIPAWNPYQFSGTPFAGDPLSGWSYLPAMILFSLLPLVAAVKSFMFLHLLLAGLSTYALARALGIGIPGAFLSAIAYEYSGLFYVQNACCFQYTGVMAWLPLAILGAEMAIRSPSWLLRGVWWGISGLAISQTLAAWFGQGSYYALLALGGYIAYRTLLSPPNEVRDSVRVRVGRLILHGVGVLVFGLAIGAFGVLPRLEYNALSNLAGGYPAEVLSDKSGWSVGDWALLLKPGVWYVGLIVLALTLLAPLASRRRLVVPYFAGSPLRVVSTLAGVVRGRFAVPYFGALALGVLVLSGQGPTPLHSALYLLPYFERLHPHNPDRVILIFHLCTALLAGAALSGIKEQAAGRKKRSLLLALPFVVAAILVATASTLFPPGSEGWEDLYPLTLGYVSIPLGSLGFLASAVVLGTAYILLPARLPVWRNLAFALLALVVFADLLTADRLTIAKQDLSGRGWAVKMRETDLASYYSPSGAARFLQSREGEEPFRYFGYDPELEESWHISSPMLFVEPRTLALEANGRPMLAGLHSVQGYNPTHIARYDQFMSALNGDEQNYHFVDVYEKGLSSPLLDLLNVRYIIVPSHNSQEENRRGLQHSLRQFEGFEHTHPTIYEDGQSKVLENPNALPRAWIVHSARKEENPKETLRLLGSGEVDPRQEALLEEDPPQQMSQPPGGSSAEQALVEEYGANSMKLKTSSGSAGLLVLSEVYYPAWKAYVDGEPAEVYATDQLLRSVPIPEGEHEVELRYESEALEAGITISMVACAVLVVLAFAAGVQYWRKSAGGAKTT